MDKCCFFDKFCTPAKRNAKYTYLTKQLSASRIVSNLPNKKKYHQLPKQKLPKILEYYATLTF